MTTPPYVSPTPDDLGLYMNDSDVYSDRALYLIGQAEMLCQSVLNPLPAAAVVVVVRVAARAYVTITSARQVKAIQSENPYAPIPAAGGVFLTDQDEQDLRNLAGDSAGAFTIDTIPADYSLCLPWWDQNGWNAWDSLTGGW